MKKIFCVLAAIGSIAVACEKLDKVQEPPKPREDIVLTRSQEQMVSGTADFAFRMLQEAGKSYEDIDNMVMSPLSASFALSMLANGAEGDTRKEITNVLGFTEFDMQFVNEYNFMMLNRLPDLDNTVTLTFANSLWLNDGFKVYDSYKKSLMSGYYAESYSYNFDDGPEAINEWCRKKTKGVIPFVLQDMPSDAMMALVNALYFKGAWKDDFFKESTKRGSFINADRSVSRPEMLSRIISVPYMSNNKYSIAELPYGNEAFSLQVILPKDGINDNGNLVSINGNEWLMLQSELQSTTLDIQLPKFKVEMNESIIPILKAMGLNMIFDESTADFSNMSDMPLFVSVAQQAASFSVDENGSEAAASTAVVVGDTLPSHTPFHVNRPFLFVLKEKSTNSILFIGKITKL